MGWTDTLRESLRYMINDFTTPYTYSDVQLNKFLGVGATFVLVDLKEYTTLIGGPYTVDLTQNNDSIITPDPLNSTAEGFVTLIVMRAALVITSSELKRVGASGGWKITDDKSTIDGTNVVVSVHNTFKMFDKLYNDTLKAFKHGSQSLGLAVLSPYSSANYSSWGYGSNYFYQQCRR